MSFLRRSGAAIARAMLIALVVTGFVRASAGAEEGVNAAGLVVDYGDGRVSYVVVPFDEQSISGIELLERSGLDLLTIDMGAMGVGICEIEDVGCDVSACRARMCQTGDPGSPFWRSMLAGDDATWMFATRGASTSVVEDGDVQAWFWSGDDPTGPAPSVDYVARQVGVDLGDLRELPAGSLHASLVTTGEEPEEEDLAGGWQVVTGGVLLLAVAGLGGYAVYRSRQQGGR